MPTRPLLVVSILALVLTGCPRGNSITVGPSTYLPTTTEPYSVDRVVLGSSIAAVRSALGEPTRTFSEGRALQFGGEFRLDRPEVACDADGVVCRVWGRTFMRGDVVLVREGSTEEHVVATLGKGWVEECYKPTQAGGGMITTGSEFVGRAYRYRDEVGTYFLSIRGGVVTGIQSDVDWPKSQPEPPRPR